MITIIGKNDISLKLKDAAVAAGLEADVIETADALSAVAERINTFATKEGLHAHGKSAMVRIAHSFPRVEAGIGKADD